ncbi:MAG: thioredoxin domain-containing protein, partial [Leptolyngbyaceae cyanobacterium CRU_2_3]|nr:thioredoxin domain-containing protein [Leptolyngbyaceae cyanobacterium CRU_2_3]
EAIATFPPARNNQAAKTQAWTGRIPAVTDTKMIVAWNSLMISGLARAAAVFQNSEYLDLAAQAAQFILHHQWVDRRFHRLNYSQLHDKLNDNSQAAVIAQSEDYALFIKALLDLHQASIGLTPLPPASPLSPQSWLDAALRIQDEFDEFLWSVELGGYYNTDARDDLVVRERGYDDNATPSANGVAIANLMRLFLLTEEMSYLDRAEQALQSFSGVMAESPSVCPGLFVALDWFRNATLIQTSGDRVAQLSRQYTPTAVYQIQPQLPEGVIGLVCQGLSCQEPARTPEQLQEQLQISLTRN